MLVGLFGKADTYPTQGADDMYVAELRGKIFSSLECNEDILTSNVFSFFKYADRGLFLGSFLKMIGIEATAQDCEHAEFQFWPSYGEGTEPDVVIIVGGHYILFEAKFFSGFGEAYGEKKHQLLREIEGGLTDAKNYAKDFSLFAITRDVCFDKEKYRHILGSHFNRFRWTNWQTITSLLLRLIEGGSIDPRYRLFAEDLYELMCKKGLRSFQGYRRLSDSRQLMVPTTIFLPARSIKFGAVFAGFMETLSLIPLTMVPTTIFLPARSIKFGAVFTGFMEALSQVPLTHVSRGRLFFKEARGKNDEGLGGLI